MAENQRTNPWTVLGIQEGAKEEEIRQAYLRLVKQHPPDHDPETFERIRDAYEELKDPFQRFEKMLNSIHPNAPFTELIGSEDKGPGRTFVGPGLWLEALKEG